MAQFGSMHGPSEPWPTTVRHDGGIADWQGARMPRCTRTVLSHAASVDDESKSGRPAREGHSELFAPQDSA